MHVPCKQEQYNTSSIERVGKVYWTFRECTLQLTKSMRAAEAPRLLNMHAAAYLVLCEAQHGVRRVRIPDEQLVVVAAAGQ